MAEGISDIVLFYRRKPFIRLLLGMFRGPCHHTISFYIEGINSDMIKIFIIIDKKYQKVPFTTNAAS